MSDTEAVEEPTAASEVPKGRRKKNKTKKDPRDLYTARLELPSSYAVRRSVTRLVALNASDPEYAYAAAVGLCVKGMARFKVTVTPHNMAQYAEKIINEIHERGFDVTGVLYGAGTEAKAKGQTFETSVGLRAFKMISESLVTNREVKEVEGNS